jgi:DNA-binding NarL/FixJ family response regulator
MAVVVDVEASDPISAAGIRVELARSQEVSVKSPDDVAEADVVVVVVEQVDADALRSIREASRGGHRRVLAVVTHLDDSALLPAVEAGACSVVRRFEATADRLGDVVIACANGEAGLAPELVGRFLGQVGKLQRQLLATRGLSLSGFTEREIDVLKLLSEGWGTADIARKLSYSERTVKNIVHGIIVRHQLRNRVHAVAHAMRVGVI